MEKIKNILKIVITVGGWIVAAAQVVYNSIGEVL